VLIQLFKILLCVLVDTLYRDCLSVDFLQVAVGDHHQKPRLGPPNAIGYQWLEKRTLVPQSVEIGAVGAVPAAIEIDDSYEGDLWRELAFYGNGL
jgi:hypothetical protein